MDHLKKKKLKNFMAPFYGWGSTASRLEPLRGGSLLFTTKFPEITGTHFIELLSPFLTYFHREQMYIYKTIQFYISTRLFLL